MPDRSGSAQNRSSTITDPAVIKMFGLSGQPQLNEPKRTFDSKFQIPKLSARSIGQGGATSGSSADDGGKKDALHSSSSAPPSTTMAAYQNVAESASVSSSGQSSDAPANMSSINLSAGAGGATGSSGIVSQDASKMLTDFFAMSNLAKMAAANVSNSSKYPIPDMHFNKNLQIYKSLSSESLPRLSTPHSASDMRDQHFSMSTPAMAANASPAALLHQFPYSVADKSVERPTHSVQSHLQPPQSISPLINQIITTNHPSQIAFPSNSASSITHQMQPPSTPPLASSSSSTDISFKPAGPDGALDFSSHLHAKAISAAESQLHLQTQLNHKMYDSRHHSSMSSSASATSIPTLSHSHQQQRSGTSPSVQVHIVKSPVQSPLVVIPSPRSSSSPCITDDELMDEALIGIGSK